MTETPKKRGRPKKTPPPILAPVPEDVLYSIFPEEYGDHAVDKRWTSLSHALLTTKTLTDAFLASKLSQADFAALIKDDDFAGYHWDCKTRMQEYIEVYNKDSILQGYKWFLDAYRMSNPKIALAALDRIAKIAGHEKEQTITIHPVVQILPPKDDDDV